EWWSVRVIAPTPKLVVRMLDRPGGEIAKSLPEDVQRPCVTVVKIRDEVDQRVGKIVIRAGLGDFSDDFSDNFGWSRSTLGGGSSTLAGEGLHSGTVDGVKSAAVERQRELTTATTRVLKEVVDETFNVRSELREVCVAVLATNLRDEANPV